MNQWETFEVEVLDVLGVGGQFTNRTAADIMGIYPDEGSAYIQLYLRAQRGKRSRTRYALNRDGQTSSTVWTVGLRPTDARQVVRQFGLDVERKITRAVDRDLIRVLDLNPRARAVIDQQLAPMIGGLVSMIDGMLASLAP